MVDAASDEREIGRRAMRLAMAIMELPIMAFLGYLLGRSLGREFEGALLGIVVGLILLIASIWPSFKSRR
ncbi:MAG: hypothetical protein ACE5KU_01035 [Nitrososphaerales archaeon]